MEEISNQNNVQIIGNFAFYKTQLKSIKGFSSVKNIRSHAFTHSCINGNVLLPPTCTKVERAAFSDTGICSVRSMARLFSFYVDPISWSSAFPNDIDIYLEGAEEITVNASSQLRNKNLPMQLHTGFDTDVKIIYEVD